MGILEEVLCLKDYLYAYSQGTQEPQDTQEPGVTAEERAVTEPGKETRPWRRPP